MSAGLLDQQNKCHRNTGRKEKPHNSAKPGPHTLVVPTHKELVVATASLCHTCIFSVLQWQACATIQHWSKTTKKRLCYSHSPWFTNTIHQNKKNTSRQEIQCLRANRTTYALVETSPKISCTLGNYTCLLYFLRLFESPYGRAFLKCSHRHHHNRLLQLAQVCLTLLNISACVSSKDCHLHQYILRFVWSILIQL